MSPNAKDATPPPPPAPLDVPVADSHTHLDMQAGTVEEALAKAASVGVTTVVQVGCDLKGSQWAADTAAAHAAVHAAVALHPNEAPRIVHGDPDGWSRQGAREPRGGGARAPARGPREHGAPPPPHHTRGGGPRPRRH
ncbi:TatD family hydrolase, partial [Streptomyces sp. NPDC059524]|uniref:TatD family hydrolase n=1 Tax=Streptomyces sp. NPDC059524 TaxID=3346856 RepID=UPI0036BBE2AB